MLHLIEVPVRFLSFVAVLADRDRQPQDAMSVQDKEGEWGAREEKEPVL